MHHAKLKPGKHDTFIIKAGHQHADAAMQWAHHLFFGYETVVEHKLRSRRSAHPDLVDFLADRKTLHAFLNQKGGDAARCSLRRGLGIDNQRVCIRRVGDPEFRAVQDVTALNRFGL